jgi:hypothetical protein
VRGGERVRGGGRVSMNEGERVRVIKGLELEELLPYLTTLFLFQCA